MSRYCRAACGGLRGGVWRRAGSKPVCAIYSTFLQRAYDPIIHDVALQHLPVRFFIDRGGLVGDDGGTHHGAFDIAYLRCVPNMVLMAPRDVAEMTEMTNFALGYSASPIAVRYPRGGGDPLAESVPVIEIGRAEVISTEGDDVALIGYGEGVRLAIEAAELLAQRGLQATVINARFCKPLDNVTLLEAATRCHQVVTIEDGVLQGGFGSAVLEMLSDQGIAKPIHRFGLPDEFVEHGPVPTLRGLVGLTADRVAAKVLESTPELNDPARRPAGVTTTH